MSPAPSAPRAQWGAALLVSVAWVGGNVGRIVLSGGSVVLPDAVLEPASVVIENDTIASVEPRAYPAGSSGNEHVVDVGGRLLLPGLVDLHNDGLESEINPRPGTNLPLPFALANLDRQLAGCGVTTEFHAVFFANMTRKERRLDEAAARAVTILEYGQSGRSLVDHQVLFRLDLWTLESLEQILATVHRAAVPLVSLNDHTPGQGQYRDVSQFKRFYREALGKSDQETDDEVQAQVALAREHPDVSEWILGQAAQAARERGFILMSHDDDTVEKVDRMHAAGVQVAEFPVTVEAAEQQRRLGMTITAGAPNVVRGGSSSGNLAAEALIERGLSDVPCADYHAPSLLFAAWKIARAGLVSLPEAVKMVTLNPARAVRLDHRIGSLAVGKQADLAVVDLSGPAPSVEMTVRAGLVCYRGAAVPTRRSREVMQGVGA
jgi:alpha-D-ribose 1-methylphosphonate 5-triphosphate diphosphatase